MASNTKVVLENLADGYLAEGIQIKGGYFVADTLPTDANTNRGIVIGSLCYNKADGKVYQCSAITSGVASWVIYETDVPTKISDLENDEFYAKMRDGSISIEGYKVLTYIETTGTQAITTSITPNQNTGFELEFMSYTAPTASNSPQLLNSGGRVQGVPRLAVNLYKSRGLDGEIVVNDTSNTAAISDRARQILRYINDGSSKKITYSNSNIVNITTGDFTVNDTITLFALKTNNTFDRFYIGRFYGLKLYNLTTLTHNLVPAQRLLDDEVGLYDTINNVFYTNSGTGVFVGVKEDVLNKVSQLILDRNVVTDNNFTNGYKNQIDQNTDDILALQDAVAALSTFSFEVVQTLPTQDISTTTIYLLPKQTAGTDNVYDEYIYVNNSDWELIGDTEIDLSNYVQKDGVKTINNESILGTGNITIEGGGNVRIDAVNNWAIFTEGNDEYFVPVTKIAAPSTPTIPTTTYSVVTGNANVAINGESGATISYSLDNGETWTTGSTIPIASGFSNDADNTTVTQGVRVKATKYGKDSVIGMYTITINPKVAQPSLTTNNPDQYAASATVVISKSASKDALTEYTTDGGTNWIELDQASLTITVTENKSAGTYKVRATKQDYIDSAISQSSAITVNKKYVYYGVTTSSTAPTAYDSETMTAAASIPTADNTGVVIHTDNQDYFYFLTTDNSKTKIQEWALGMWNDVTTTKSTVNFTMMNGLTATYYCLRSPLQGASKDGRYTIV